jgi:hypothetical protein
MSMDTEGGHASTSVSGCSRWPYWQAGCGWGGQRAGGGGGGKAFYSSTSQLNLSRSCHWYPLNPPNVSPEKCARNSEVDDCEPLVVVVQVDISVFHPSTSPHQPQLFLSLEQHDTTRLTPPKVLTSRRKVDECCTSLGSGDGCVAADESFRLQRRRRGFSLFLDN